MTEVPIEAPSLDRMWKAYKRHVATHISLLVFVSIQFIHLFVSRITVCLLQ